ncbi:hypothetical protein TDB9533_03566 [Thalassocella blandensis]|nr:hypothetical protein TDB9533_03566 [Thalassocella blandensis]
MTEFNESAPGADNLQSSIPEKFQVFGESNSFDLNASVSKLSESYSSLTKRLGTDETKPDSIEGYSLNAEKFGEGFDVESFLKEEGSQAFLQKAHEIGLTNSQLQAVVEHGLLEFAPSLRQGEELLNDEAINSTLRETWQTDAEYHENMTSANRFYRSLPDELQGKIDEKIGNDPSFIQVAALIGREMKEDSPPPEVIIPSNSSVESVMASQAYRDSSHPDHEKVSKQVKAYFEKKFPSKNI